MNLALGVSVAAIVCWVALCLLLYRFRPPRPVWPVLFWYAVFGLCWSVGEYGTSFLATDSITHWRWLLLLYTGVLLTPAIWWSIVLRFAEQRASRPEWATPLIEYAPLALAVFFWLALVTNPLHGGFIDPVWDGRNQYRLLWYVQAAAGYLCLLGSIGVLLWLRARVAPRHRTQLNILVGASILPVAANLSYVARIWPLPFDPTNLAFPITLSIVFIGMVRNRLFTVSGLTLDHLIRHESDGVAVVDATGRVVLANPAVARLLGLSSVLPDEDFPALLESRLDGPGEGRNLDGERSLFELLSDERQPEEGYLFRLEAPDGAPRRWLRVKSIPLPGRWPTGHGLGIRLRDETKLQDAIERAAQQAVSIEAILSSIQDGLFVVDGVGRLVYANERFWEMWDLPRVIPAGFDERGLVDALVARVAPRDGDHVLQIARDTATPAEGVDLNLKSGAVLSLATSPLIRRGEAAGRVWTFRDVTERVRAEDDRRVMEDRMRESQKLESLGVLAGGIAHDFNNILVGILGNVELAMVRLDDPVVASQRLVNVKKSTDRAAELVQQLLAYAGRGQRPVETVCLSTLVGETRELVQSAVSKKAELRLLMRPNIYVDADPVQLRQIVMNLITNASDALGEDAGTIRIETGVQHVTEAFVRDALPQRTAEEGDYAFLEISDTGCGMDSETLGRVFEPFFSTKFTGRGLGLSAALGIVRRHRGFIKVKTAPGEGTTFLLLLPVASRKALEPEPVLATSDPATALGTILVVDDEQPVRAVARSVLEMEGFRVLTARDGKEGLTRFREYRDQVGAVLLDMMMPRMDGAETLKAIRELSREVPVILSSGYSERDTMARCEGIEGTSFIQKPYTATSLAKKIRDALRSVAV